MHPRSTRRAALAALCLSLGGLAPLAVHAAEGYLVTGDWDEGRVRIQSLSPSMVVYDLTMQSPAVRSACGGRPANCFPMSVHHTVYDDRDFLTTSLIRINLTGGFSNMYPTTIARFELTTPAREAFSIRTLDFRDLPNRAAVCDQSDTEAFADSSKPGCSIQMAHGFKVIDDRPADGVYSIVLADALNARVLGITLDYSGGSTTGHVDFALGGDNPGWPSYGLPNAVQHLAEPDGDYLLVTFYMDGDHDGSAGSLVMFKQAADGSWEKQWRFPEAEGPDGDWLLSVHMGQILTDPTSGRRTLFYSHGRALADDWEGDPNADLGGSVGVMRLGSTLADPPTYLGEGVPFLSQVEGSYRPYRYARDVEFLPDGRLVLTDASCENFCPEPAQHFITQPFHLTMEASPMTGAYTPDHLEQDLLGLEDDVVDEVVQCGHLGIFETDYITTTGAGRHLKKAGRVATLTCADATALGK